MAGPRRREPAFGRGLGLDLQDTHDLLPDSVVAVRDLEGNRPAERLPAAETPGEARLVLFDLHAAAASVAVLSPREVGVHRGDVDPETGRQPGDEAGQEGAVGLAGGLEREARHAGEV